MKMISKYGRNLQYERYPDSEIYYDKQSIDNIYDE